MESQTPSFALRRNLAVAGVIGLLVIAFAVYAVAGRGQADKMAVATMSPASTAAAPAASSSAPAGTSLYRDGTYTADGSYRTPQSLETITVKLTLKDGIVTASDITSRPIEHDTREYQVMFEGAYKTQVIGKSLDSIKLSRVAGSSLTSSGFNAALGRIRTQAQAS